MAGLLPVAGLQDKLQCLVSCSRHNVLWWHLGKGCIRGNPAAAANTQGGEGVHCQCTLTQTHMMGWCCTSMLTQ